MSSYRKTMGEAYNGMYLVEGNIDKIKDIVSKKSASKIDGVTVDIVYCFCNFTDLRQSK